MRVRTLLQWLKEVVGGPAPRRVAARPAAGAWQRPDGPVSVLIVKLDEIGDMVSALPALERLREAWPGAELTLLCFASVAPLLAGQRLVDRIVAVEGARPREKGERRAVEALAGLRATRFDIAIDLRHDQDTRWVLDAVDAACRVGYGGSKVGRRLDVTLPELEKSQRRRGIGRLTNRVRLLLLAEAAIAQYAPPSRVGEAAVPAPGSDRPYVVIAPGARSPIKRWPVERWIELCRMIGEAGRPIVLVGDADDAEPAATIVAALPQLEIDNRVAATSLAALTDLLRGASLFVGLDTGIAHLAGHLARPIVIVFSGQADIQVWAPRAPSGAILHADVPCAPCHAREMRQCLFQHRCMTWITAARVFEEIERLLPPG